jgi:CheY-like chemotaxis protein
MEPMGKKILIVEDDPIARKAMERLLSSHPRLAFLEPRVVQAASGQQGLAVFVAERPDLIITDLFMPAMDGFAFCRSLREAALGKSVPVIVISGIYKDPELARSLKDEVDAYFLPKPLQADELVRLILSCLESEAPGEAPAQESFDLAAPLDENAEAHLRPTVPREVAIDLAGLEAPPPAEVPAWTKPAPTPKPRNGTADNPIGAGSLEQRRVGRLIFDIADTTLTGTLGLSYGKIRKDLYVRGGQVVAADSNLRQEALGTLLCARGLIDEGQLAFLLAETKRRGHKMGAVIIELGWMTPDEVLQALAAQARKRIVDCIRWDKGTFTFTPGDAFGDRIIEHDLDVAKTVLLGLYRSATPETLVTRFDQSGACPVELTPRFARYRDQFEAIFDGDVSQIIREAGTVGALALREDAHVVMAQVEALLETGMAELGPQVDAAPAMPSVFESPLSLEKLGAELNKRFDAILDQGGNVNVSFAELRKGDILPLAPTYPRHADESTSGALDIGSTPNRPRRTATAMAVAPTEEMRQRLLHEYLMIHGKSHYDILGVTAQSPIAQIERAVLAKLEAFSDEALREATLAPADRVRLDAVRSAITQAGRVLCSAAERSIYDEHLHDRETAIGDPLGAELAFGEAMQLFQAERFDEALAKFEAAVAARPDQALYHAYLGWADFVAHGPEKASEARDRLQHALALDPDLAETHAMLGRMAATEDDAATARLHLERSLTLAPDQPETAALLLEAYRRLPDPDPHGAERFLRKVVSALGDQDEALSKRIWSELGELYEHQLDDRSAARIAYDSAARLSPQNLAAVQKSGELNAEDPARWRETARALAAEWQIHPDDVTPARKLFELFAESGQPDAQRIVATAMVLRNLGDDTAKRMADEACPATLPRLQGPLPENLLARVGYRPEESDLEKLAELLVETGIIKPFSADDLGLLESDRPLLTEEQPAPFRSVLEYVCSLFQIPPPEAILNVKVLGGDARMADLRPPALLCGEALLECDDSVELGFRLARAVALCAPGRRAGSARSGGQMRPYFLAALSLANAAGPLQGEASLAAAAAIAALDPAAQTRIADAAYAIKQKHNNLNLSVWGRGLARLGTRLALLLSGDLLRIGRAIIEEDGPAALDDLLLFALSLDYIDLRKELGLTAL